MKKVLVILLLLIPFTFFAQSDSLNQYNTSGKKNSIWQIYLNSLLFEIQVKSKAFFIAFESYDNDKSVFKHYENRNNDADSMSYSGVWPKKGSPQLLTGVFEWFLSDGRISNHEEYRNGWPWYFKSYAYSKKKILK